MALAMGARSLAFRRLLNGCHQVLGPAALEVWNGPLIPDVQELSSKKVSDQSNCSSVGIDGFQGFSESYGSARFHGVRFYTSSSALLEAENTVDAAERGVKEEEKGVVERGGEKRQKWDPASRATSHESRKGRRSQLLRGIKEWPVDVDLDEKFPDGKLDGFPVEKNVVTGVLYIIANGPGFKNWAGGVEREFVCDRGDALRALNLFLWWQKRNPEMSPGPLLDSLLKALAGAGLRDELQLVWAWYKDQGQPNGLPHFLSACFNGGMYDEVVKWFEEAREKGWPLTTEAADMVLQAMQAKGCSRDEVWAFYKRWVEDTGNEPQSRQAMVALLKSGLTVPEIRSLRYTEPNRATNRVIKALSTLGQQKEAGDIVQELLHVDGKLGVLTLIATLRTLIQSGFVKEAQQLADKQAELGLRLDGALAFLIKKAWSDVRIETGLIAYETLLAIEGPHKKSLQLQALLISRCFNKRDRTEQMYEAYKRGKLLDGHFHCTIFTQVLDQLASTDRATEAEGVLADYFAARKEAPEIGVVMETAFESLAHMYLRAKQPQKLVEMVKEMVKQNHVLRNPVTWRWATKLDSMGCPAEAKELKELQTGMGQRRNLARRESLRHGSKGGAYIETRGGGVSVISLDESKVDALEGSPQSKGGKKDGPEGEKDLERRLKRDGLRVLLDGNTEGGEKCVANLGAPEAVLQRENVGARGGSEKDPEEERLEVRDNLEELGEEGGLGIRNKSEELLSAQPDEKGEASLDQSLEGLAKVAEERDKELLSEQTMEKEGEAVDSGGGERTDIKEEAKVQAVGGGG